MRALQRFAARLELTINEEKTKVIVFSRGGRASGLKWNIGGQTYEEVATFKYLGVTFQRNGTFTKHHTIVTREVNRRIAATWSAGEKLFSNSYRTRIQMLFSLVIPVMLYAAEVTGYSCWDPYETAMRRYVKWTLGLPSSTRNCTIVLETALKSAQCLRLERALRYENALERRESPTLRAAYRQSRSNHEESEEKVQLVQRLGWNITELEDRMVVDPNAWRILVRRCEDQYQQVNRAKADKINWYSQPERGAASYLSREGRHYKTVARFRCGAECRGLQRWTAQECRICTEVVETAEHVAKCGAGVEWTELSDERGRGIELMKKILDRRML